MKAVPVTLILAVAAGGLLAGFLAYRHGTASPTMQPPVPPASPPPVALPPDASVAESPAAGVPSAPSTAHAIPEVVPVVALQDLDGQRRPLRDGSGNPHLYNFWATWCEPCRREIPLLNSLQGAYRADRLQVVGIAVDFRDAVREFLKTQKLGYELRVGEEDGLEAAQKFGMELNLPFSVFADGEDRIIAVKVGELHRAEADAILQNMRSLKSGRITLAQARAAIAATLRAQALARAKQSIVN